MMCVGVVNEGGGGDVIVLICKWNVSIKMYSIIHIIHRERFSVIYI